MIERLVQHEGKVFQAVDALLNPNCLIVDVHKMGPNGEVAKGFVRNGAWWYSEENYEDDDIPF